MTLADAFKEGTKRGIIDWRVRVDTTGGLVKFYIHPADKPGVTLDFSLDQAIGGHEILIPASFNQDMQWSENK